MENGISSLVKPVSYEETLASLPPRRSPYEAFSYLLQPPSVRDRAPAQPAPSPPIEIAPMPMPTQPMPTQPMPTQPPPPPARPPMQTDPMPRPDPTPVTPEAFDPVIPMTDPVQQTPPDPIIDTKPTPTTLAELEAMLGYKWIKNEDTSPIRNRMYTDQDRLRDLAKQYGIALPPDAPIDMTGFEDPPLGSTPPVGTTPPANVPAAGTVINLPFGGSFTIPDDIQERIDAAKAAAGTATTTTPRANIATTTSPMVGGRRGLLSREAIENLRKRVEEMRTPPPTPMIEPPAGAPRTIPEDAISEDLSRLPQGFLVGEPRPDGRGGLLSRLVDDSVPVVSPPSEDILQRSIDNLRDIFGRASEGGDGSSGSGDMFSKLRDRLRPTDTRDPRRLPPTLPIGVGRPKLDLPTLPINVGQQRVPQFPMPRRVPTVPPPKPARRQIPVNTDKQDMVRRALSERMQNVGRLLGRGRGR